MVSIALIVVTPVGFAWSLQQDAFDPTIGNPQPWNSSDYRDYDMQTIRIFAVILFGLSVIGVIRVMAIRRADLTQGKRIHRIQELSSADALAALKPPLRTAEPPKIPWYAAMGRALHFRRGVSRVRSNEALVEVPSPEELKGLYSRERTMRLIAFGLMALTVLMGILSGSFYDSAECIAYSGLSCIQLDPEMVALSYVVGALAFVTFITAASFWWRALSLQTFSKGAEARLAEIERVREGNKEWYPLSGSSDDVNGRDSEGAREGS